MIDISKIIGLRKNSPATVEEVNFVENKLRLILPKVYRKLLNTTNGLANGKGIGFYGTDELVERNETWEVYEYAKGYVAVGDNSGGKVFLMKSDLNAKEIIAVDSGYMNPDDEPEVIATDFEKWISEGCIISKFNPQGVKSSIELHNIILEQSPIGGTKDLLMIKKVLGTEISIGDILKGSQNPPFVIMENVPYAKAIARIEELGGIGKILRLEPVKIPI